MQDVGILHNRTLLYYDTWLYMYHKQVPRTFVHITKLGLLYINSTIPSTVVFLFP